MELLSTTFIKYYTDKLPPCFINDILSFHQSKQDYTEVTHPSSGRLTYHHLGQRLQGRLQLVGGGKGVGEVHGSRQQQQGRGDLLVQMQLQPLQEPDTR